MHSQFKFDLVLWQFRNVDDINVIVWHTFLKVRDCIQTSRHERRHVPSDGKQDSIDSKLRRHYSKYGNVIIMDIDYGL